MLSEHTAKDEDEKKKKKNNVSQPMILLKEIDYEGEEQNN